MNQQPIRDAQAEGNSDYDRLPEPVKQSHSLAEYLWLSDEQKATLMQDECEPDW